MQTSTIAEIPMNDSVNNSCKSSELTEELNISPHTNAIGDAESTAAVELVADVAKPSMFPIEKASGTLDKGPAFPLPTDIASGPNDKHNGNATSTGDHRGKQKTSKSAPKMNKATNDSTPRSFHNQDVYIRMNYLFHAAHYISTIAAATGNRNIHDLSSSYADTACKISQRTVCRLASETKTLVCKRCHAYLIAGETARVRVVRTASDDLSSERQDVLKARRVCSVLPYLILIQTIPVHL